MAARLLTHPRQLYDDCSDESLIIPLSLLPENRRAPFVSMEDICAKMGRAGKLSDIRVLSKSMFQAHNLIKRLSR